MLEARIVPLFLIWQVYAAIGACVFLIALDDVVRAARARRRAQRLLAPDPRDPTRQAPEEFTTRSIVVRTAGDVVRAMLLGAMWPLALVTAAGLALNTILSSKTERESTADSRSLDPTEAALRDMLQRRSGRAGSDEDRLPRGP